MQHSIVLDPEQEPAPTSIVNGLGEVMVLDHVTYFQVFVGNQIARADKRVCRLPGKIFTLPTDLQMRLRQVLSGLAPVFRSLVLAGDLPLQALESFFRLAVVTGVLDGVTLRVRIVGLQAHVDPDLFPARDVLYLASGLDPELAIVAIGTVDNPHSLDLPGGERFHLLLLVAHQPQAPNPTAIREPNVLAVGFQLPARLFVLHGTVIMLERGIALLAGLVVLAVVIEAFNGEPGTICRGLSGLGVELGSYGILTGKQSTIALEIILGDTVSVHPLAQALVPDELNHAQSFINGLILLFAPIKFVFLNEHPLALSCLLCDTDYTALSSVRQQEKHMKRTNLYLTEKQVERLHERAEQEGLALAELVRRAVDAFLAWDDPAYVPQPKPQTRHAHSSPA